MALFASHTERERERAKLCECAWWKKRYKVIEKLAWENIKQKSKHLLIQCKQCYCLPLLNRKMGICCGKNVSKSGQTMNATTIRYHILPTVRAFKQNFCLFIVIICRHPSLLHFWSLVYRSSTHDQQYLAHLGRVLFLQQLQNIYRNKAKNHRKFHIKIKCWICLLMKTKEDKNSKKKTAQEIVWMLRYNCNMLLIWDISFGNRLCHD